MRKVRTYMSTVQNRRKSKEAQGADEERRLRVRMNQYFSADKWKRQGQQEQEDQKWRDKKRKLSQTGG